MVFNLHGGINDAYKFLFKKESFIQVLLLKVP